MYAIIDRLRDLTFAIPPTPRLFLDTNVLARQIIEIETCPSRWMYTIILSKYIS